MQIECALQGDSPHTCDVLSMFPAGGQNDPLDVEYSVLLNRLQARMVAESVTDADLMAYDLSDLTKVLLPHLEAGATGACWSKECCLVSQPLHADLSKHKVSHQIGTLKRASVFRSIAVSDA